MKLSLKNIGKVRSAGRTLFSVFNSFYNINEQILRKRIQSISSLIDLYKNNMGTRYLTVICLMYDCEKGGSYYP